MTTLYFIITKGENHLSILNDGGGASELLFYTLARNLSKDYKVIIYNLEKVNTIIDNIEYNYLNVNNLEFMNNIENSTFIIQRHFDIAINLHKINSKNHRSCAQSRPEIKEEIESSVSDQTNLKRNYSNLK